MTAGVGKWANNPCNMRVPKTWKPSVPIRPTRQTPNGIFAQFESSNDGITACTELYNRFYKDLSASTLVSEWTDGGGNAAYRAQVASCY